MGIIWQVFLAAIIPAIWATAKTSPLAIFLSLIIFKVSGCITTEPSAIAIRCVSSLPPTSTICALPFLLKWLSFFSFIYYPPILDILKKSLFENFLFNLWPSGFMFIASSILFLIILLLITLSSVFAFLIACLISTSLLENKQGLSLPSEVNLIRLQVSQKCWLRAVIKPMGPWPPLTW